MNKELLLSFNMIYEDYSLNSKKLILYPLFELIKTEIFCFICAFLWAIPIF